MSASQEIPELSSQNSGLVQIHSTEYLSNKSLLKPQPFQSSVPILGTLVVWFRGVWNSVSTRWYLQPLIEQQSEFNHLLVQEVHALNQGLLTLNSRVNGLNIELQNLQVDFQLVKNEVQSLRNDLQVTNGVFSDNLQVLRNDLKVANERSSILESGTERLTHHFNELTIKQNLLTQHIDEVSDRLIAGDREIVTLVHDVGDLTYSVIGLNARLAESTDGFSPSQ